VSPHSTQYRSQQRRSIQAYGALIRGGVLVRPMLISGDEKYAWAV